MGSTSNVAITNNTRNGGFDATWASLYNLVDMPQYYPELVSRFGKAFEILEFLKFSGQEGTCANQTLTVLEKGAPERYITLHAATGTVAAKGALSLEIEEWSTSSTTGQSYVSVGDKVAIPASYCTVSGVKCTLPQWFQVTAIASTTANPNENDTVITAYALNQLTVIGTTVPAATKLMVTGGNYAAGSEGAHSKTHGWYSRTFTTTIKKAALQIEGSVASTERRVDHMIGGGLGVFSDATIEAEFRLDKSINDEIIMGDTSDWLTQVNSDSVANIVRGTIGIMPSLKASGCKQYYTTSYGVPDVDNIKKAFISQGVTDTNAAFFVGAELLRGIENNCLDFVKEYSGGSDFLTTLQNLEVGFKTIKKNGITLSLHELVSFSNPNTFGNYGFDKYGFIIPSTQVTVRDSAMGAEVKIANLRLLYKSYGAENRTRIMAPIPGVNGLSGSPNFAVNSFDEFKMQWLSEFMLTFVKVGQSILVQDDSVL